MPSVPVYVYAHTGDELYVNLYVGGTANVELGGRTVRITQKTDYPWDGQVKIALDPGTSGEFDVLLRIPGWARNRPVPSDLYRYLRDRRAGAAIEVNGKAVAAAVDKGYVGIRRKWKTGDVIKLDIPMPIRRVAAHPKVEDNSGYIAVERGPIVYCAEWKDNGGRALDLVLADDVKLVTEHRRDMLGGVTVVKGRARDGGTLTLIPYYAWAHRGPGEMAVWLARTSRPFIASGVYPKEALTALDDGAQPKNSADRSIPRFTWGDHKGRAEWVQRSFTKPRKVGSVEVYWFDDEPAGGDFRVPRSLQLMYRDREGWKPVAEASRGGTVRDRYNKITFAPVTATALRLEARFQPDFRCGILELKIN